MKLNINTDAAVVFTNKLEKLHRSALPNAIRGALNKAAFDVKQNTMPATAGDEFDKREPNFFKANSRVEMAKGYDLRLMKATVGFTEKSLRGGNNFAVQDLEDQEHGGKIEGKSFIPLDPARTASSYVKPVRPVNRLSKINKIYNAKHAKGKNPGQRFVKSVIHAGKGGHVLSQFRGKEILWRVNSINRTRSGSFKLSALYSYKKGRSVKVAATYFMRRASLATANKMDDFFISEAKRQMEKLMSK